MRLGRLRLALVLALAAAGAGAQQPQPAPPTGVTSIPVPPAAITPSDLPAQLERTNAELRDWETRLTPPAEQTEIEQKLPRLRQELAELGAHPLENLIDVAPRELEDVQRQWEIARDQLAGWADTIAQRTQGLEGGLTRLRELDEIWGRTATAAAQEKLPDALIHDIGAVRTAIRGTQVRAKDQRDRLLTLGSQIGTLQATVVDGIGAVQAAAARLHADLLAIEEPPLWTALGAESSTEPVAFTLIRTWQRVSGQLVGTARSQRGRIAWELTTLTVLLTVMFAVRRRCRAWPADDPDRPAVRVVVARPISSALILGMVVRSFTIRAVPLVVGEVSAVLALAPLLFLLYDGLRGRLRSLVPLTAALFTLVLMRRALPIGSTEARLLLAFENLALVCWTLWAVRPAQVAQFELSSIRQRALVYGSRAAAALLAVSFVSNLVGNVTLALVTSRAVVGSAYLALLVLEIRRVLTALVVAALHAPGTIPLKAIANHAPVLQRYLIGGIRLATAVGWVLGTLDLTGLLAPALGAGREMLAARLEIGALSLSASDVIALGLTIWLSIIVARLVRFVLEDDVLPHMDLPRGVPSAISAAANYAILLIGFLLALSAAGLELGRVAILAGAFGVGIGFGLQNVVNNFVSGLILLVERPIRLGDVVEFGGVNGWVSRIGIRSSTIATFDGAEVIVPNASLISDRVTNWTFSASQRRIELRLGVAYGGDPATVLAILQRVAAAQEDVLRQPAPQALFLGFGDTSLNFVVQAWTSSYDLASVVTSRLGVAIYAAMREAGIAIPVVQRDARGRPADVQPPPPSAKPA